MISGEIEICSVCGSEFESAVIRSGSWICDPCISVLRKYGIGPRQLERPEEIKDKQKYEVVRQRISSIVDEITREHRKKPFKTVRRPVNHKEIIKATIERFINNLLS